MEIVNDPVGRQSEGLKRFSKGREIASSDDAEIAAFMKETGDAEDTVETVPREREDEGSAAMKHIAEIVPSIGHGIAKATQEVGNLAIDAADLVENFAADQGLGDGEFINDESQLSYANDFLKPETMTGEIVAGIAQFMAPMGVLAKGAKGVKAASKFAKFLKAGAMGAAVDFAAFDPQEKRLSNLIQTQPALRNPVSEYLAANPKDSKAEGRFKNALEGIGIGTAMEGFMATIKAVRGSRVAKNVMKDSEEVLASARREGVDLEPTPKTENIDGVETTLDGAEQLELKIDDLKKKVKAKRPSQQPIEDFPPEIPGREFVSTTDEEAAKLIRGFEDVATEGKAININLDRIEAPDDVKKAIKAISEQFPEEIDEARRGIITNDEAQKLADAAGMDVSDILNRVDGQAMNAEEIIGTRRLLNASAEQVYNLSKQIADGDNSRLLKAKFLQLVDQHRLIQAQASGAAAEAGRALQAYKIPIGMDNAARNRFLDDIVKHGGGSDIEKTAAAIAAAGGKTSDISKLAHRSMGRKLKDAAKETWINSLLSGPMTHAVNMSSNALTAAINPLERKLAEQFSAGAIDSVAKGEAGAMFNGMMAGITDSFRMAKESYKTGDSAFRGSTKFERGYKNAVSADAFGLKDDTIMGRFLDFSGKAISTPTRLLESSDEFFKSVNYRMEINAQAHRKAHQAQIAEGLSQADTDALFKKFVQNPDESIKLEALNKARENTFTKPLDEVKLRGMEAESIDQVIRDSSLMRIVAPFTKTNLNLVEFSLNRTPFAKGLMGDLKAGGLRRDTALSRISFGMGTMALGGTLAHQGILTGRGPTDLKARKTLEAGGWKEYSIKVGDSYIGYDRLDPFGSLLGIAADASEIMSALSSDREVDGQQLAIQTGTMLAQFFTPEFVTKNVNDFLDVINGDERKLENFLGGVARGAVPFSSFAKSIRKEVDPVDRDRRADPESPWPIAERMLNEIKNTIPGLSDSLPPKRNMFGEAKTFMTFRDNPNDEGPIDDEVKIGKALKDELVRLNTIGDTDAKDYLKLDMPDKYIRKGGVSVKLSPEKYDRLVQLSAGIELDLSPFPGRTLKEVLTEQVETDYPLLEGSNKTDEAKMLLIKEIVSAYRSGAKAQLLGEDEDMTDKFIKKIEKKQSDLTGEEVKLNL